MNNRLLREPDVIKAILENKEMFRTDRDIQRFAVVIGSIPVVDVELNLKLAYERGKSDRPQEKTVSVDALREILSDVKEAHRNNSEAEVVIADIWDEVVDMLKGSGNEA